MSNESAEAVQSCPPPLTYHPDYNDPEADMTIRTNDGTLFRVPSYFLKAASPYFRSLPSKEESPDEGGERAVIDVEGNGRTWANLLDLVTKPTPSHKYKWSTAKHIIEAAERYQFENVIRVLVACLDPTLGFPWDVFVLASQYDYETLARNAIAELQHSKPWRNANTQNLVASRFAGVPPRYIISFVLAISENEYENGWSHLKVNWANAAKSFNVCE